MQTARLISNWQAQSNATRNCGKLKDEQQQSAEKTQTHAHTMGGLNNPIVSKHRISHSPTIPSGHQPLRCAHAPRTRPLQISAPRSSRKESEWTRTRVVTPQNFAGLQPKLEKRKIEIKAKPKPPVPKPQTKLDIAARSRMMLTETLRNGPPPNDSNVDKINRRITERAIGTSLISLRFVWKSTVGIRSIFLYGSFNGWETGIPLKQDPNSGSWSRVVRLPSGTYWYRYLINGAWSVDNSRRVVQRSGKGKVNEVCIHPNF